MGDLSLKVVSLFGTADPAVANKVGVGGFSHKGVNVVPTLSRSRPDCLYPAVICVLPQGIGMETEFLGRFAAWDVSHMKILPRLLGFVSETRSSR